MDLPINEPFESMVYLLFTTLLYTRLQVLHQSSTLPRRIDSTNFAISTLSHSSAILGALRLLHTFFSRAITLYELWHNRGWYHKMPQPRSFQRYVFSRKRRSIDPRTFLQAGGATSESLLQSYLFLLQKSSCIYWYSSDILVDLISFIYEALFCPKNDKKHVTLSILEV